MPKLLKILLNIVLIPIFASSLTITIISFGIGSSFSNKNIKKTVKTTIQNSINKKDAEDTILNGIYQTAENYGIEKEFVDKVLLKENVQTLISEYIYYVAIEPDKKLEKRHLDSLIDNAFEDIKEDIPIIPDELKEELKIELYYTYNNQKETINRDIKANNVDAMTLFTKVLKFIKSNTLKIPIISSLLLSLLVICIVNFKKYIFMRIISITSIISSLSIIGITELTILIAKTEKGISNIIKQILNPLFKYSLILLVVSIMVLIGYIIIRNKTKKEELE